MKERREAESGAIFHRGCSWWFWKIWSQAEQNNLSEISREHGDTFFPELVLSPGQEVRGAEVRASPGAWLTRLRPRTSGASTLRVNRETEAKAGAGAARGAGDMAEEETEGRNSPPERDSTIASLAGLAIPTQKCSSAFTRYNKSVLQ